MMQHFIPYLSELLEHYGYLAVVAGVLLENAGVPMSGELTLLATGSAVAAGKLQIEQLIPIASMAVILGDTLWYCAGRLGSTRLIGLYCRISFGSAACVAKTENTLARFGPRSLVFARFIPGLRTFAAPMAGMSGLPYSRFLLYDGIGALLWTSVVVSLGVVFTHEIARLVGQIDTIRTVLLGLAAGALVLFIFMKLWIRRRHGAAFGRSGQIDSRSP